MAPPRKTAQQPTFSNQRRQTPHHNNSGFMPTQPLFTELFKKRLIKKYDAPHITASVNRNEGRKIVQIRKYTLDGEPTRQGVSTTLHGFKNLPFTMDPLPPVQVTPDNLMITSLEGGGVGIAALGKSPSRGITGIWLTDKEWKTLANFTASLEEVFKKMDENEDDSWDETTDEEEEISGKKRKQTKEQGEKKQKKNKKDDEEDENYEALRSGSNCLPFMEL